MTAPTPSDTATATRRAERGPLARLARVLGSLLVGTVLVLLALEVVCRFLPVNGSAGLPPVTPEDPIAHLEPNSVTTRSRGPRLSLVTEVRTNNVGFRNDVDYLEDAPGPLVALVGDSYVAAATVPFEETTAARLTRIAAGHGRVYSFGLRGAAFPQYLAWASWARDAFHPEGYVFLVIPNDFAGSLLRAPSYHYFVRNEDGSSEMRLAPPREQDWRRDLMDRSALARYLFLNCQIRSANPIAIARKLFRRRSPDEQGFDPRFVGNIDAEATRQQMEERRWAFLEFLDRVPEATGVPMDRVAFVLAGLRPHMYDPEALAAAQESAWAGMRAMVLEIAAERGLEVVDLHERFQRDWEERGVRFDSPEDMHWNGEGHRVVAEAVAGTRAFRAALGMGQPESR